MPKKWTPEEDELLVETFAAYYNNQHWVYGQRFMVWPAIGDELGRSGAACRRRLQRLKRKAYESRYLLAPQQ